MPLSMRVFRSVMFSGLAASIAALATSACDGGEGEPAAPIDAGGDASATDTGGVSDKNLPTEPLKVLNSKKEEVDADLSCIGRTGDAGPSDAGSLDGGPLPGEVVDQTFRVVQYAGTAFVAAADVDIFYKNSILVGEPEAKGKTGSDGRVSLKVPFGERFTYRVNANESLRASLFFDSDPVTETSMAGTYELSAVTRSTYDQFAQAITGKAGFVTAAGRGVYSSRVLDCNRAWVANAVVEIVDAATFGPLPTGAGDADLWPVHYLTDQEQPSMDRHWTSRSGFITTINVPETKPGGQRLKAIAKGIYGGSRELRPFAEVELEITAAAVNFRALVPR